MDQSEQTSAIQSPYMALILGRDEDEQYILSSVFLSLDDHVQDILVGEGTLNTIRSWISSGLLPETHALAISKLIGMIALEDPSLRESIAQLLTGIGIPESSIAQLMQEILNMTEIFIDDEEVEAQQQAPTPIPPLPPSAPTLPRNTIDLRNKPTA